MDRPWLPERTVDAQLAQTLIADQFPQLAPFTLTSHPPGWDNTVFVAVSPSSRRVVFRFPRREVATELLEIETRVLSALDAIDLGLETPAPRFVGVATEEFPWPFVGYVELAGLTADRAQLSAAERMACARPLGRFLRALHADAGPARTNAPRDSHGRLEVERRRTDISERLSRIKRAGLVTAIEPLERFSSTVELDPARERHALCHGDLYARHLIVGADRRPVGVIDWGDTHVGPAALDVAIAYTFFGEAARGVFFEEYGELTEAGRQIALYRAMLSAVTVLVFGDDSGDDDLVREGRVAIENVCSAL